MFNLESTNLSKESSRLSILHKVAPTSAFDGIFFQIPIKWKMTPFIFIQGFLQGRCQCKFKGFYGTYQYTRKAFKGTLNVQLED